MKEGRPLDNLQLVFEGEFELTKEIAKADAEHDTYGINLKEFLP